MPIPCHFLCQLTASGHAWGAALAARAGLPAGLAIPNPAPASPGPGSGAIATLLAWAKWLALAACAISAVAAGGMIAIGSVTRRAELASRGKAALIWAVVGAFVVAVAIPLVNHAFSLG
jgi:hypothetical protein